LPPYTRAFFAAKVAIWRRIAGHFCEGGPALAALSTVQAADKDAMLLLKAIVLDSLSKGQREQRFDG